jgi:hypothetical protein
MLDEAGGAPVVAGTRSHDIETETVFALGVVHLAKAFWRKLGIEAAIASRLAE